MTGDTTLSPDGQKDILPPTPPLIFSLCAPGLEPIAIFAIICAFMISSRNYFLACLLCVLSVFIDRSMLPNAAFLLLITASPLMKRIVLSPIIVLLTTSFILLLTQSFSAINIIGPFFYDYDISIFGISYWEILYNSKFGSNNFFSLAASMMGLYGWMSIKPFLFWLYYPVIIFLFMIGITRVDWYQRSFFCMLFLISFFVMWLLPPLSQARYYPLLTLSFWTIVVQGVHAIKIKLAAFHVFILITTFIGCLIPLAAIY